MPPVETAPIITTILSGATSLEAFMLLCILGLCAFIWYLMKQIGEMQKAQVSALLNNTTVMTEIKEMVRGVLYQKA